MGRTAAGLSPSFQDAAAGAAPELDEHAQRNSEEPEDPPH
jgi:hypothetical protein